MNTAELMIFIQTLGTWIGFTWLVLACLFSFAVLVTGVGLDRKDR